MTKLTLVVLALASGCVTVQRPTLDGLRDQFVVEGRDRGVVLRPEAVQLIFVNEMNGTAAGRCYPNRTPRLIEINRQFWDDSFYADDMRRQVVYHELGHCLLGIREHVPNLAINIYGSAQIYVSIMEREPIPYDYYHGHEAEWLDRLFGRDLRRAR